ncbi:uncharacterized protein LOC144928070 [Branchiostoma floridae x Branchiostoma belcheri]
MSSQRGNVARTRPQKHKNTKAFKNNMHDQSQKTKKLNAMVVGGLCGHCKSVIDWKIKYKKYKPLSQPKKCVKCEQKTVKQAYTIMCMPCARTAGVCAKCGKSEEVVTSATLTPAEEAARDAELQQELKFMSERQRRTFMRYVEKGGDTGGKSPAAGNTEDSEDDSTNDSEDEKVLDENSDVASPDVQDSKSCDKTEGEGSQQDPLRHREDMAAGIDNAAEKCDQLSI